MWGEGRFLFPFPHTISGAYCPFTSYYPWPYCPPDAVSLIEVFDGDRGPIWGLWAILIFLRPSQLVLTTLLLILGRWNMYPYSPFRLLHVLTSHHHLSIWGKGQAKDVRQALLGRQPKYCIPFQKRKEKCVISSLPALPFGVMAPPLPLIFSSVIFIEGNENLKHGRGGWAYSSLVGIIDFWGERWMTSLAFPSYK